jgi:hypothetical protein
VPAAVGRLEGAVVLGQRALLELEVGGSWFGGVEFLFM